MKMDLIEKLNTLVAQGRVDTVLNELKAIFLKNDKLNEVILHSARHSELKESIRLGLIDYETASVSKNKITFAILELISEIDEAIEGDDSLKSDLEEINSKINIVQNHTGSGDNVAGNKIINN